MEPLACLPACPPLEGGRNVMKHGMCTRGGGQIFAVWRNVKKEEKNGLKEKA